MLIWHSYNRCKSCCNKIQQLNFALGDTDIVGKANVSVTGKNNVTIGDPTVAANATVIVSGKQSNLATGTVTIVAVQRLASRITINAGNLQLHLRSGMV